MEKIVKDAAGTRIGLFIPIDSEEVIRSRAPEHVYGHVLQRMQEDESAIQKCLETIRPLMEDPAIREISDTAGDPTMPYWDNGFFGRGDGLALIGMLRHSTPKKYVEIGSGNSTKFARWALRKWSIGTRILSIDPAPRAEIDHIADEVMRTSVLQVDCAIFDNLQANDVLFHDGSHLVFNGTDTVHLFLEILPRLTKGVLIHIHDICLPYEYVSSFDNRGYSEQYLLAASLLFGGPWEILLPVTYLAANGRLPIGGTSFWFKRK